MKTLLACSYGPGIPFPPSAIGRTGKPKVDVGADPFSKKECWERSELSDAASEYIAGIYHEYLFLSLSWSLRPRLRGMKMASVTPTNRG